MMRLVRPSAREGVGKIHGHRVDRRNPKINTLCGLSIRQRTEWDGTTACGLGICCLLNGHEGPCEL
jgi:hypothetical protein